MSNELIPVGEMLPVGDFDQKALDDQAKRNFLPYVLLIGKTSALAGTVTMGEFILQTGKETYEKLTSSFEALVLGRRPRACRKGMTGMLSVFDMKDPEYQKIVREADGKQLGSWYGNEFLIWLRNQERYATFHAGNPTARGNSTDMVGILKKWIDQTSAASAAAKAGTELPKVDNPQVTFKSALATGQGQKYWAPFFFPSTTPFSKVPAWEDTHRELLKFVKPPKNT